MSQGYVLSFAGDVSVDNPAPDQVVIQTPDKRSTLKDVTPGLVRAIEVLSSQGATEDDLARQVAEIDGRTALTRFYRYLAIFAKRRMIKYVVFCNGRPLATLSSNSAYFQFNPRALNPQIRYVLSRFAYLHRDNANLILESPLSHAKITLHGWRGAALAAELARAQTCASLCDLLDLIPRIAIELFLGMLLGAGFGCEERPGDPYEGEGQILAQWDFHDLLFHERRRRRRHADRFGSRYRFYKKNDPLAAVKPLRQEASNQSLQRVHGKDRTGKPSLQLGSGTTKFHPGMWGAAQH